MTIDKRLSGGPAMSDEGVAANNLSKLEELTQLYDRIATAMEQHFSPRIKLLNIDQGCAATGLGTATIFRRRDEGKFPAPQEGLGKNMWRETAIISWLDKNDPNHQQQEKRRLSR